MPCPPVDAARGKYPSPPNPPAPRARRLPPQPDALGTLGVVADERDFPRPPGGPGPGAGPRPAGPTISRAVLGARIVAAFLSLAVLIGAGWSWSTYRNFNDRIARVDAITQTTQPAKDVDGKDQNILIVGNDDRDTATDAELKQIGLYRDGGSTNTDTMMLIHVPANGKRASAVSLPRDSYVNIPGVGMGRLNSAYADGRNANNGNKAAGARLLVRTIQKLTGLRIDHFVQIDLLGFYRISNAIGGVKVCLNAAQNASTENDVPSDPHPKGYSGIDLKKGVNVIQGKQALAFVRQRHGLPNGDLDRIKRQQYFLSAVFRKVTTAGVLLNPFKLQRLLKAVSSSMQMDGDTPGHKGLDPLALGRQLQNLAAGNLTFTTIPTTAETVDGNAVLAVDADQLPVFMATVLGTSSTSAYGQAHTVKPATVSVAVLNGTPTSQWAGTNATTLGRAGFRTTVGDATQSATTLIQYPAGMEAQAKTLAGYVRGATVTRSDQVSEVTLVLGTDGRSASAKRTSAPPKKTAGARTAAQSDCIN